MRYRPLAPGLPSVSLVGFGGMPLSIQGRPDSATAQAVLHAALDAGVTLIDTADSYCLATPERGHNERLIGAALRAWPGPRDRILVATKGGLVRPGGAWELDGRPAHLREACERSLRALGVEQIALYQLHAPDPAGPFEAGVTALAELQRQGKLRWIGLSNVSVAQIETARAIAPIATVQNRLNPFFREALREGVVAYCGAQRLGFLAYSPVGGGRLNRKLPDHPVLQRMSARLRRSPHAIVTAWVLAQGPTVYAIPGARRVDHAVDAAAAADLVLEAEDLAAIDHAEFDRR
jgi:aryl-alcohol dehydrogenase-like predicted oxidoreductase